MNNSGFPDDREKPFDKRTFELSVKYRLTDKHSFYLMVPLYVDYSSKKQNTIRPIISFPVCIASGERNSDIIIPYLIGKASTYSGVWVLAIYIQKEILNILQSGMEINGLTIFSEEKV